MDFNKDIIITAIRRIEKNTNLRKRRESKDYDLVFENKSYPPILVLSEANKLINGSGLTLEDFNNSISTPFEILKNLGFEIVKKQNGGEQNLKSKENDNMAERFSIDSFYNKALQANCLINRNLIVRLTASLLSKPFVILTGLSGSGKTNLALAFAKYMSETNSVLKNFGRFNLNEEVKSTIVTYKVIATDSLSATFMQLDKGTKVTLPYELIYQWINVIEENSYSISTSPRTIRKAVDAKTKYSRQLNSFETHLKAAAFYLMERGYQKGSGTSQVCVVPVGSDWTNREPLLGYPNSLEPGKYVQPDNGVLRLLLSANAPGNEYKPFFLILDEMNLSHVERYFSDFLSAMESSEPILLHDENMEWQDDIPSKLTLPKNLFIIGTVNIDETTYMFSPKVLDRANVIEFRVTKEEMEHYLSSRRQLRLNDLAGYGMASANNFMDIAFNKTSTATSSDFNGILIHFFSELRKTGAEFGYRTANEICNFASVVKILDPNWSADQVLDSIIMQKLLPKLHGSRRKVESVLRALAGLCISEDVSIDEILTATSIEKSTQEKIKFPLSFDKIRRMNSALVDNGFTSYAEA